MSEASRRNSSAAGGPVVPAASVSPFRTLRGREGARILSASPVFAGLDAGELEAVAARSTIRRFSRGEALTTHGGSVDWLIVIGKGRIKAVVPGTATTPELLLGVFLPGDVIGEIGIFENVPRVGSHIAVVESEVLLVPKDELLALLDRRPLVSRRLLEAVCTKLRLAVDLGLGLRSLDLPSRFYRRLLYLAKGDSLRDENGLRIQHGLSQQELADSIAASRETLNRLMGEWKDAGLITYGRGYLVIRDPDAMARLLPDAVLPD